jgi:hypothetical protein
MFERCPRLSQTYTWDIWDSLQIRALRGRTGRGTGVRRWVIKDSAAAVLARDKVWDSNRDDIKTEGKNPVPQRVISVPGFVPENKAGFGTLGTAPESVPGYYLVP